MNLVTLKRVPAMRKQAQTSEISDGQLSEISYKAFHYGIPLAISTSYQDESGSRRDDRAGIFATMANFGIS